MSVIIHVILMPVVNAQMYTILAAYGYLPLQHKDDLTAWQAELYSEALLLNCMKSFMIWSIQPQNARLQRLYNDRTTTQ